MEQLTAYQGDEMLHMDLMGGQVRVMLCEIGRAHV